MNDFADLHRRRFILNALAFSSGIGLGCSLEAVAQEQEKRQKARHILSLGSPYDSTLADYAPHMHRQFKFHVEQLSEGRIYVDILDNGRGGIGTELMARVSRGHIGAALISTSNLSPIAPALDILNIPFWSADNQSYLNLVTSDAWRKFVVEPIKAHGKIDILFHYVIGPRTATTTKQFNTTIKTPSDLNSVIFRVPASKVLDIFYQLAGTHPVNVAWKDVAQLARSGRINALDPSIIGLFNGPGGLKAHLGTISLIESVHDGWAMVVSQQWLSTLSTDLQQKLYAAARQTFKDELQQVGQVTNRCAKALRSYGCKIYRPNEDEKAQWIEQCGHQRPQWSAVKKRLLGDEKAFEQLLEASKNSNGFHLNNHNSS